MRLEAKGVCKWFGRECALAPISVSIPPRSMVVITGPSGSGKSTLLGILSGLIAPTEGTVEVIDPAGRRHPVDSSFVSWVPQGSNLLPARSVFDNVIIGALAAGRERAEAIEATRQVLRTVGLLGRAHDAAKVLSGGEAQRVALARGMASRRELMFADEPTGNLDRCNTEMVLGLLRGVTTTGTSVVVATHDPRLQTLADDHIDLSR